MSYILTVFININSVLSVQDIRKLKLSETRVPSVQITGNINIHEPRLVRSYNPMYY